MHSHPRTRSVSCCLFAILMLGEVTAAERGGDITFVNDHARYVVTADGHNLHFVDRRTGTNYCTKSRFAQIRKEGKNYSSTAIAHADGKLNVTFGGADVSAVIKVTTQRHFFVFEVESVRGEGVESLTFLSVPFTLKGLTEEPFGACALAMNLKTRVWGFPGMVRSARAACYPRFGLAGAKVALVGTPRSEMRAVLKEAVTAATELARSTIGGPWALDAAINRGSYLFCGRGVSEKTVGDYIRLAQRLGITQLNLHAARYGDWKVSSRSYPRGRVGLKAVIDEIHAAGMVAGLHTYSFFINRSCPYVTPKPDPRLGKDATFTLGARLTADATTVPVVESTEKMSAITGFFVRNSVTLQIDDELITYKAISKEPPYAFTECKRGAFGTQVGAHVNGARVHHLRQCFHLFVPDGDSTLFSEVAEGLARLCNEVGFDMLYLDALDGGDAVAGRENAWHYRSKFVHEFCKKLDRPRVLEAATFPHLFWMVRTRTGAWDHPTRSHKKFIDIHVSANKTYARYFLPGHFGWWAFKTWHGPLGEPTLPDDIEYLCGKCLGMGYGLSIQGISPSNVHTMPALPRLATITRRYENLRHANYFTDAVKEKLLEPGREYTLSQNTAGEWQFREIEYNKHKVQGLDSWSNTWTVTNRFGRQPLRLRIEALMSAKAYDAPDAVTVAELTDAKEFAKHRAAPKVKATIAPSTDQVKIGKASGCFSASSQMGTRRRAWARVEKTFDPPAKLSGKEALGLWVYGDGKGEVLNLQTRSPIHITRAYGDHYIDVNFKGWRYLELIEPEGKRHADYSWPYGGLYQIYRERVRYSAVEKLTLYYNNLPPKETVTTYLSPIRALPVVRVKLRNAAVTIGGQMLRFPVAIESGCYLELRSPRDCKLYGPKGELVADVTPEGDVPVLEPGENRVEFQCECDDGLRPRAYVSVVSQGDVLRGRNPDDQVRWEFLSREEDEPRVIRALDGVQNEWDILYRAGAKQPSLEIEIEVNRVGARGAAYHAPNAVALETFDSLEAFKARPENRYLQYVVSGSRRGFSTSVGVTHRLELCREVVKVGQSCARYTAASAKAGGWSARGKRFSPLVDLSSCTDVGFWLHGDGAGEILYLQLRDVKGVYYDMKTKIDFTGWKYVELGLTGAALDLGKVEYLIIYYNGIPSGQTVSCCIDDVRGLRAVTCVRNPSLTVAGEKLVFPVSLAAGDRLLYAGDLSAKVMSAGSAPKVVQARGVAPKLRPGPNRVRLGFGGTPPEAFEMTVRVTKVYR